MFLGLLPSLALAVPMQLDHQGRLTDGGGVPLSGGHSLEFALYDSETSTAPLWSEVQPTSFDDGYFHSTLGLDMGTNPLQDSVFDGAELWIGVAVDGAPELNRQRVRSVPYAVRAGTATNVVGGIVDATAILVDGTTVIDGSGTFTGTVGGQTLDTLPCSADQIPLFDGLIWTCTSAPSAPDWTTLTNVPADFADGLDNDTLAGLLCADGEIARWNDASTSWMCAADQDAVLDEAAVDGFVANNGYALDADIAAIGKSGDWTDLVNVPSDLADGDDDTQLDETAVDGFVANNGYALDADIAAIGKSGDWGDLLNVPSDIADGDQDTQLDEAAVDAFVSNNGYALDADISVVGKTGDWADLVNVPADFADGVDNQLSEAAVDAFVSDNGFALDADISVIGKTGAWNDIVGTPADFADGVDNVLTEAAVDGFVSNNGYALNSTIAAIGFSGDWSDLVSVPGGFADGIDNDTIYTDGDAVAAVAAADDYVLNTGDTVDGSLNVTGTVTSSNSVAAGQVVTIRARGTGLNYSGNLNRNVFVDGTDIVGNARGLNLVVIERSSGNVVSNTNYDTHGSGTASNNLATALNALDESVVVVLTSYDAWTSGLTQNLRDALARVGASNRARLVSPSCCGAGTSGSRSSFALIGIPGTGVGAGIEVLMPSVDGPAELSTALVDGDLVGYGKTEGCPPGWYDLGQSCIEPGGAGDSRSWGQTAARCASISARMCSAFEMYTAIQRYGATLDIGPGRSHPHIDQLAIGAGDGWNANIVMQGWTSPESAYGAWAVGTLNGNSRDICCTTK